MPRHHDYGPMSEHPPDDPATQPCEHPGCHGDAYERGLCETHYHEAEGVKALCPVCGGTGEYEGLDDNDDSTGLERCHVCHGAGVVGKGE